MEPEGLVNVNEAAKYLGVRPQSVRIWCSDRQIPFYKVGNRYRFKMSELEQWAKDNARTIL